MSTLTCAKCGGKFRAENDQLLCDCQQPAPEAKTSAGDWMVAAATEIWDYQYDNRSSCNSEDISAIITKHASADRAELAALKTRVAEFGKVHANIVPGNGEGVEVPATPESIKSAIDYLQSEWDGAEIRATEIEQQNKALRDALDGGVALIAQKRASQTSKHNWTPGHDDEHTDGSLAVQAAILACKETDATVVDQLDRSPWSILSETRIDELAVAGALLAAEIDRKKRAALSQPSGGARE